MNRVTSAQFTSVGTHLYLECGYRQLSEKTVTEHLNLDMKTFNQMFADKDEFVKAMLIEYSSHALGRASFDLAQNTEETKRLYQIIQRLAIAIREHLVWIHRILLDSVGEVESMTKALKKQHKMLAYGMIQHIRACNGREDMSELELFNQFESLNGAIISPMITSTRYQLMGILTDEMNEKREDLLTDSTIHQRINWASQVLFPQYRSQKHPAKN